MKDYWAAAVKPAFQAAQLDSFEALWALQLDPVDQPNVGRGGCSSVYRLSVGGADYFMKRQTNHTSRSLRHPLGEPTFAREFRNILRYQQLKVATLDPVFFAQRKAPGEQQAILITRALNGWSDLSEWLERWQLLAQTQREAVVRACAQLISQLHAAGMIHGCFYPKHVFLREQAGQFEACLIDLEKTRRKWFGTRDSLKDLEPFRRRNAVWQAGEWQQFIADYLPAAATAAQRQSWLQRLDRKQKAKESRRVAG